ncbi:glycosyltransferase family 2 protein [Gluconobacter thailandicus]|uniref:Glycosyltransferase family 2 protein n=1 Tax=Gluconobacter thailandicus TaxID=257438 RepID=A0AAP9EPK9_GLUTH|nr:glycosyltransferase family 2 protein [Gluconobacter thailandicus]QEH95183.1 glycosyltransferase family 2 protein [Gluconobacter thailandicus]
MKVAVVAIVRDEASDILAWLGWYVRLGVDTVVLFDDGSTDGMDRLVTDAACVHDIRLYRIKGGSGSHVDRQRLVYLEALEHLKAEFDWIGFLDADEYLSLQNHDTIQDFLGSFPDEVGAVGINWCNYGSSGHVTKPLMPAFHAFTHHYKPENGINRHVKSFLRPDRWSGHWYNVHYFDVAPYSYVDPAGREIYWSDTKGIIQDPPDWNGARILHFQLRSMEHYIDRARKRKDITLQVDGFTGADHNDVYDPSPQRYTSIIREWERKVARQCHARVLDALLESLTQTSRSEAPAFELFTLTTSDKGLIGVKNSTPYVMSGEFLDTPLLALRLGTTSSRLYLLAVDQEGNIAPLALDGDANLLDFLPYDIVYTNTQNVVALRQADQEYYLGAVPAALGGQVFSDRRNAKDWELFELASLADQSLTQKILTGPAFQFAAQALSHPASLQTISALSREELRLTVSILPLLTDQLEENERQELKSLLRS